MDLSLYCLDLYIALSKRADCIFGLLICYKKIIDKDREPRLSAHMIKIMDHTSIQRGSRKSGKLEDELY